MGTVPLPGDYFCVRTTGVSRRVLGIRIVLPDLMGLAIRVVCRSRYNHAALFVGNGTVIEAQPGGAVASSLAKYDGCEMTWSSQAGGQPSEAQRAAIITAAWAMLGRPYGWPDILWLLLAQWGIRWRWLLARVEDESRLICSQLIALAGQSADPPFTAWLCGKPAACMVTPADLSRRI